MEKLHIAVELVDALVHAFVAAAEQDYAVERGQFTGYGLGEGMALGGEHYYGWALPLRG